MMKQSTPILRDRARQLRRNQTDAERTLWSDSVHDNFAVLSFAASILSVRSSPTSVVSNNVWWWSWTEVNMPHNEWRIGDGRMYWADTATEYYGFGITR
jgi:hypothetical protein